MLSIVGVVLLSYGVYGLLIGYTRTKNPNPELPNTNQDITFDTAEPDETTVDIESEYEVPLDQPRRIIIPSLGVNGFIQRVGQTEQNKVAVPTNIHFGGWYAASVIPGQPGLSLIDGHVSGRYQPGIFKNIHKLKDGDKFSIEYGDRSQKQFEVVSKNSYSLSEINSFFLKREPSINSQLNLITCGGRFDGATQSYDERVLVVSRLLE